MRTPFATLLAAAGLVALGCNNTNSVGAPLAAPQDLASVSLNQAIDLYWADNSYASAPSRFLWYRIFSTSYDNVRCGATWQLEGTTIAPEFLVGALTNGVPRCYTVTAVALDGAESDQSLPWQDTPRPDARNVVLYASATKADSSGFLFWDDANNDGVGDPNELGLVENPSGGIVDFKIDRNNADSTLWLVPVYSGTTMLEYGTVDDLTSIDYAPATGYSRDSLQAFPGDGYVFHILDPSGLHYGAVRVTHVGRRYLILDWSVQTDPGNPELVVRGGLLTAKPTGSMVATPR